jgi:glycosyltransferase involved in cell wall biosynthesis
MGLGKRTINLLSGRCAFLRISLISKYPPIEGGVSSQTYWISKALGERGHKIFIVTNAQEVEKEYREEISKAEKPFLAPQNICIFSTDPSPEMNPMHIPASKSYAEKLASLAIETVHQYNVELIDAWYLLPYGVSSFIAKIVTGRRLIVRHGGSDLGRLFSSPSYKIIFKEIFRSADKIVTYADTKQVFLEMGISESKLAVMPKIFVDPEAFNPQVEPFNLTKITNKFEPGFPVITYIGKVPYLFETKGLIELIKAAKNIKEEFLLLFVANGTGLSKFKQLVQEAGLENRSCFLNFLPPWKIPSIMKTSTCIVVPQYDFPFPHFVSNIPLEAMAVGKCLIISEEMHAKEPYTKLVDGESVLIINPRNINQFRKTLEEMIKNKKLSEKIGSNAHQVFKRVNSFFEVVNQTIQLYEEVKSLNR